MAELWANNASARLALAISASDTTAQLTDGDEFPEISTPGDFFRLTLDAEDDETREIVIVTDRSGDLITFTRQVFDNCVVQAWPAGTLCDNRVTKETLELLQSQATAGTEWGDITGTLSDQTDLQTALDAKLTTPADPNADRILFWDDSAGQVDWLIPGTNLTITNQTLDAAGGGGDWFPPWWQAITTPVLADFTAINQGTASATTTNDTILLTDSTGAVESLHAWVRNAPATPYSRTMLIEITSARDSYQLGGFVFRDSGTGKLISFAFYEDDTTSYMTYWTWDSPTVYVAEVDYNYFQGNNRLIWFRATDNGTNIILSVANDGVNFTQLFSVSRTNFLANPNQIGFGFDNEPANLMAMRVVSWA